MLAGASPVTTESVLELSRITHSLAQQLRAQSDILRQRGMNLPPGTVKGLESMHIDLEKVAPRVSEQQNELDRLRKLADTTGLLTSSLNLDEVLITIVDTVVGLTGAERGYIMLSNEHTGELEFRYARGMNQQDLDSDSLVVSKTIVSEVAKTGEPLVTTNAQEDDRFAGQHSIVGYNLRSILCAPLISKEKVQGVVYADNSIRDALFGRKELQLLTAIASQAALAIENARLFQQAQDALEEITRIKNLQDNILASIASGVITTDATHMVTTYNLMAQAILGIPDDTVVGRPLDYSLPMVYQAIQSYLDAVHTYDEGHEIEAEPEFDERGKLYLNLKMSPLKDSTNQTQGMALVVDDLTELKRRDSKLNVVRRYLPPAMVDDIANIDSIGLEGKRRDITVIFVEVRSFNSFDPHLRAGDLMQLLNEYLTTGTGAIHRRSGMIDKYMGSEIMGIFNSQLNPSEHHAWDALQAAIDMAHDFEELYARLGEQPKVPFYRVGIHTGIATLGNVGGIRRREFSAIGDTVNLAKRLQENATTGQIIVSDELLAACGSNIDKVTNAEIIELEPLYVKGRLQPAIVYELNLTGGG